jgi:hypothetical protein
MQGMNVFVRQRLNIQQSAFSNQQSALGNDALKPLVGHSSVPRHRKPCDLTPET